MRPDRIRFVYFDLDDTLLDHRGAERRALADLCADFPEAFGTFDVAFVQDTYHRHNIALWERYADGRLAKADLKRLRFEQLLHALSVDVVEAGPLGERYLERYARHWTLGEDARRAFDALADRFPVGILTNGFSEIQHEKLARFPELRDRLRCLVISDEVGAMKPSPAIFAYAAAEADVPAEGILYVGDSYRSDVQGALGAGWQMAWYAPPSETPTPPRTFRFDQWSQLLAHFDTPA